MSWYGESKRHKEAAEVRKRKALKQHVLDNDLLFPLIVEKVNIAYQDEPPKYRWDLIDSARLLVARFSVKKEAEYWKNRKNKESLNWARTDKRVTLSGCGSMNEKEIDGREFDVSDLGSFVDVLQENTEVHLNYFRNDEKDLDMWVKVSKRNKRTAETHKRESKKPALYGYYVSRKGMSIKEKKFKVTALSQFIDLSDKTKELHLTYLEGFVPGGEALNLRLVAN